MSQARNDAASHAARVAAGEARLAAMSPEARAEELAGIQARIAAHDAGPMTVGRLRRLLADVGDDALPITILYGHAELPIGSPTLTIEGGGAAPRFVAINAESSRDERFARSAP
jgi:hypothetical protein